MENLYIIGNGFDLYHGLDTRYQSFANFLAKVNSEIYDLIITYYGLPDISDEFVSDYDYDMWSTFEAALANLDYEQVLDDNSDYAANPGSPEFRDRDWHAYQFEMEFIIEKLTTGLISIFNLFILNVEYPKSISGSQISVNPNSLFLNFNYTNTLERYYGIPERNICYIHNKVQADESKIILGHGIDPDNFIEEEVVPPSGLSDEEMQQWEEFMSDQYDLSYESAKEEILTYYTKSFKNTDWIIRDNINFFDGLASIENVYIMGHSISPIDIKYFETVKKRIGGHAIWHVSYYSDNEMEKYRKKILNLGVSETNIKMFKIADLQQSR